MAIIIALIFVIAALAWIVNRVLSIHICPICAGVSGTWVGLLALRALGYAIDSNILAMLMGGSVVGIAYQVEKRLLIDAVSWKTPLLWKMLFIPTGFIAVYHIVSEQWNVALIVVVLCAIAVIAFLRRSKHGVHVDDVMRKQLAEKMKNCC